MIFLYFLHLNKGQLDEKAVNTAFIIVSDIKKELYNHFGVQSSWKSLINKSVVNQAIKGLSIKPFINPEKLESELLLPADFLIDEQGMIIALHYGE